MSQPAANSPEAFQAAIAQYRQQSDLLNQQLAQLETNYRQQKEQATATLHMLNGAIAAIEQLVKNVENEAKAEAEAQAQADAAAAIDAEFATDDVQRTLDAL